MAAPVESGQRHEQQIGIDGGRLGARLGDIESAGDGRIAHAPEPEGQWRAAGNRDRQGGREALGREGLEKRERVGLVANGRESRNDSSAPLARAGEPLLDEAGGQESARLRIERSTARQRALAQQRFGSAAPDMFASIRRSLR